MEDEEDIGMNDLKISSFEAFPEDFRFLNLELEISQVLLSVKFNNVESDLIFNNIFTKVDKSNSGMGLEASLRSL
jgi:hypothetical protein